MGEEMDYNRSVRAVLLAVSWVVVQVMGKGVGELLRAVVLVVEIEEDAVMVVK
jgi:hypothetical protein